MLRVLTVLVLLVLKGGYGFSAVHQLIATEQKKVLISDNYPNSYPRNLDILYVITVFNPKYRIAMNIEDFMLESSLFDECNTDRLEVHDGPVDGGEYQGTYCDDDSPPTTWFTKKNTSSLIFITDGSVSGRGFKAIYYAAIKNPFEVTEKEDQSTKIALITGGVIFGVVIIIIVCGILCYEYNKKKKSRVIGHYPVQNPEVFHQQTQPQQTYQQQTQPQQMYQQQMQSLNQQTSPQQIQSHDNVIQVASMQTSSIPHPIQETVDYNAIPPAFKYIPPNSS